MLKELLSGYNVILGSGSPRRHELLKGLDIDFKIDVRKIDEHFPQHLKGSDITDYLAMRKAEAFSNLKHNDLLITSDTIVWKDDHAIGKASNYEEAVSMLEGLSGSMHQVITSVAFTTSNIQKTVNETSSVWFRELSGDEIAYYLKSYEPYDKAGSYGIQEWLGYVAIKRLEGSYFNVMGFPIGLVYKTLMEIANG